MSFAVCDEPPPCPSARQIELGGWHVDRFSHALPAGDDAWAPRRSPLPGAAGGYCAPRACNLLGYLQDMDEVRAAPLVPLWERPTAHARS